MSKDKVEGEKSEEQKVVAIRVFSIKELTACIGILAGVAGIGGGALTGGNDTEHKDKVNEKFEKLNEKIESNKKMLYKLDKDMGILIYEVKEKDRKGD